MKRSKVGLGPAVRGLLWGLAAPALGAFGWVLVWAAQLTMHVGASATVPDITPAATASLWAGAALGVFCMARGFYLQTRPAAGVHALVALLVPPKQSAVARYRLQAKQLEPDVDARDAALVRAPPLSIRRYAQLALAGIGLVLAPLAGASLHGNVGGASTVNDDVAPVDARESNDLAAPDAPLADEPFEYERVDVEADFVVDHDPALRARREKEAKTVEKETIILYDRRGDPMPGAPYEVSLPGYHDVGVATAAGTIEIPKFSGVERCRIRWSRPSSGGASPPGVEPSYELEAVLYLHLEHPNPDEKLRRQLANLGFNGRSLSDSVSAFQLANGRDYTGIPDDVRAEVDASIPRAGR